MPDSASQVLDADGIDLDDLYGDLATNHPDIYYAHVRRADRVYYNRRWGGWIVTGFEEVAAGYRDHARLSSERMAGPWGEKNNRQKGSGELSPVFKVMASFFGWMDPPDHTRFRKLLQAAFTPVSLEEMRPRVGELVREYAAGIPDGAPFDFINRFAFHLPVTVISEYLGARVEDRHLIGEWSEDLGHTIFAGKNGMTADERARLGERAINNFIAYFTEIIEDRRRSPRDDLISRLVRAEPDGDPLTHEEIVAQSIVMLFAGHETTTNLLANGMVAFARFPEQWRNIRKDPALVRPATEEMLRFDGPIGAQGRWARTSFEFGGKAIRENDRVMLMQWAANRDPEAFEDPDTFDVTRKRIRHLGFGHGIHTCLGSPLARIEVQETLRYLTGRYVSVELATEPLTYKPTLTSRSLTKLDVVLQPA
ncbi:cytochrome P450 [Dactylosporangium sucinum]|uniref:Biotin biosynthesis cytochrome P450 n=1 Tax=Dactylosporangium sucinum TaxID=1424081 RepID=A0A917UEF5_9ACTN|nr:cytochrome P450 [Dactylosporangium sucinum]GGM87219.1 biotin biosynthesis cytochrome P450 [Dactylosporangium sucinum]